MILVKLFQKQTNVLSAMLMPTAKTQQEPSNVNVTMDTATVGMAGKGNAMVINISLF